MSTGDFSNTPPNQAQLDEAQSWIAESIASQRLSDAYALLGLRNLTQGARDAQYLFREIERWPNFNSILDAYL